MAKKEQPSEHKQTYLAITRELTIQIIIYIIFKSKKEQNKLKFQF